MKKGLIFIIITSIAGALLIISRFIASILEHNKSPEEKEIREAQKETDTQFKKVEDSIQETQKAVDHYTEVSNDVKERQENRLESINEFKVTKDTDYVYENENVLKSIDEVKESPFIILDDSIKNKANRLQSLNEFKK